VLKASKVSPHKLESSVVIHPVPQPVAHTRLRAVQETVARSVADDTAELDGDCLLVFTQLIQNAIRDVVDRAAIVDFGICLDRELLRLAAAFVR
jgi:hypothetical protein